MLSWTPTLGRVPLGRVTLGALTLGTLTLGPVLAAGPTGGGEFAHSVANINDPRSHGVLGDNLLSLNEVILLNKRALTIAQLSAAEAAQIFGAGPDIAFGDIDASVVPVITLEGDLDPIEDTLHGMVVQGSFGRPVIDLNGHGPIVADSNFVDFRGVEIRGGDVGIRLTQTSALFGTVFGDLVFTDIGSTAIEILLTEDSGATRVEFDGCRFEQVPTAIEVFDTGANRLGQLLFDGLDIRGGQRGLAFHLGAGGAYVVDIERSRANGTANAIVFDRPTAADTRTLALGMLHVTLGGGAVGLDFEGSPNAFDALTLRMVDFGGQTHGLKVGPLGAAASVLLEDSRLAGPIELRAGTNPAGIDAANLRVTSSALSVGTTGGPVRLEDSILTTCTTTTAGSVGLRIDGCRIEQGSLTGSATAPIQLDGSYVGGAAVGAHVSVSNQLLAPQLGSADIAPTTVSPGGSVTLAADLPDGLVGVWFVGIAETIPIIGPRPLHLYFFLSAYATLPIAVRNQQQFGLPIPNAPILIGWDWVGQLAVLPDPGVSAPPISLPPGRLFEVR